MCYSVCAARPFMDQCIKACCFEYQTRLWLAPPAPLCRTDCMWSLSLLHSNRLKRNAFSPPRAARRTTVVLFNRSPSRPLLAQHAACRGPFSKQRSPRSHMQNLWLQRNTKEERDPVLSRGADIGFQIPNSCTPRHCSTVWLWQKEWGKTEREEKKCSCLAWVYFHPVLQSFFFLTVRRGSRLPSTTGLSLVLLRTPEKALIFYLHWVQVEAAPDF